MNDDEQLVEVVRMAVTSRCATPEEKNKLRADITERLINADWSKTLYASSPSRRIDCYGVVKVVSDQVRLDIPKTTIGRATTNYELLALPYFDVIEQVFADVIRSLDKAIETIQADPSKQHRKDECELAKQFSQDLVKEITGLRAPLWLLSELRFDMDNVRQEKVDEVLGVIGKATQTANTASEDASVAAKAADSAAEKASDAALHAVDAANTAAQNANVAAQNARDAVKMADAAAKKADNAASAATAATEKTEKMESE